MFHRHESRTVMAALLLSLLCLAFFPGAASPASYLQFDGTSAYAEAANSPDFSVPATGAMTVSAWIRPDAVVFPDTEGSGYVYWLGKGGPGAYEWAFRMYSQDNSEQRANRISFYVFNPAGGLGIGSYFQASVTPGEWIHVAALVQGVTTSMYRNGVYQRCDQFQGAPSGPCERHLADGTITPQAGAAPLRIGTLDMHSFFEGSIADVGIWNRALTPDEIAALYAQNAVPPGGLVAFYPLDEGAGSVAYDITGQHNATITNANWSAQSTGTASAAASRPPVLSASFIR